MFFRARSLSRSPVLFAAALAACSGGTGYEDVGFETGDSGSGDDIDTGDSSTSSGTTGTTDT
ncbi:MAG: hypothetical protein KC431_27760, partial [Myxococcales bacterium]|nr:hypothetical protein [Myxococcales bacterium]